MATDLKPFKVVKFGEYQAIRNGENVLVADKKGKFEIMEIKDFYKFLQKHVPNLKGQPAKDTFVKSGSSLVSTKKDKPAYLKWIDLCISDSEENGGINGKKFNVPKDWGTCEERPTTVDPKTGKRVYKDTLRVPGACYLV